MEGCLKFQWGLEVGGFRWGASFLVEECAPLGGIGFDMGGRGFKKIVEWGRCHPMPAPLWETLILAKLLKTEVVNNEHLAVPSAKII